MVARGRCRPKSCLDLDLVDVECDEDRMGQRSAAGSSWAHPSAGLATLFAALPPRVSARRRGRPWGALVAFLTRPLAFALRTADRLTPRFL